jgi:hypothetical protein
LELRELVDVTDAGWDVARDGKSDRAYFTQ